MNESGAARLTPKVINEVLAVLCTPGNARIAILESSTGSFCEGLDLAWLGHMESQCAESNQQAVFTISDQYRLLLETIQRTPVPVISLVDGAAMGGGLGIVAACDLVLASPRATFGLPETIIGLIPAHAFPYVAQRIGVARTKLLALGKKPLRAREALRFGLVDVVSKDLESTLKEHSARFLRTDAAAIKSLKKLVADHFGPSTAHATDAIDSFVALHQSPATQARLKRFISGEAPWEWDEG